jgi:hypothetical protein
MFKVEKIVHLSWDWKYLIDLKNDRRKGKTTRLVIENKKIGRT